jgi:hypothetical protein
VWLDGKDGALRILTQRQIMISVGFDFRQLLIVTNTLIVTSFFRDRGFFLFSPGFKSANEPERVIEQTR